MKTTDQIKSLSMEDFQRDSHLIDYVDESIAIVNAVDAKFDNDEMLRLDCLLIVFCLEGRMEMCINSMTYTLEAEQCAILIPNTLIRRGTSDGTCNVRIIAISTDFLRNVGSPRREAWDIGSYLYNNPIFPINRESGYRFYLYKELILSSINEKPRPFLKESKRHLFSAVLCEMLSKLYESIPTKGGQDYRRDRSMYIFRKFMEKVTADDGTHRSVAYFADLLCYSPKHISTVVKRISGKSPLTLINEHAMQRIKYELKHSERSMKEIADMFEFSNPSFFGKFVKQHLGMSPQQYRNREN